MRRHGLPGREGTPASRVSAIARSACRCRCEGRVRQRRAAGERSATASSRAACGPPTSTGPVDRGRRCAAGPKTSPVTCGRSLPAGRVEGGPIWPVRFPRGHLRSCVIMGARRCIKLGRFVFLS